jgi:hypothetical protein
MLFKKLLPNGQENHANPLFIWLKREFKETESKNDVKGVGYPTLTLKNVKRY